LHLLFAVQLFFFTQRRIFKNAAMGRQRAAVAAVNLPLRLQNVEVFANRNLGGVEVFRQMSYKHTAVVLHHFND
jgi:hypothetical protein